MGHRGPERTCYMSQLALILLARMDQNGTTIAELYVWLLERPLNVYNSSKHRRSQRL